MVTIWQDFHLRNALFSSNFATSDVSCGGQIFRWKSRFVFEDGNGNDLTGSNGNLGNFVQSTSVPGNGTVRTCFDGQPFLASWRIDPRLRLCFQWSYFYPQLGVIVVVVQCSGLCLIFLGEICISLWNKITKIGNLKVINSFRFLKLSIPLHFWSDSGIRPNLFLITLFWANLDFLQKMFSPSNTALNRRTAL